MSNVREFIKKGFSYFDGGFGTVIQAMGLPRGVAPEEWNIANPHKITAVHEAYINAGANFITTNTFGINKSKYSNYKEMITAAVENAKKAATGKENVFIAFDIGPTGKMLKPLGDLAFEDAYELFSENVKIALECGVDLFIIETMNDSYETKAAVLAVKENCDLPIFVTNVYDKSGKLMTGATPQVMIAMLESLGVDALGLNCSFGPDKMLEIIDSFRENCSIPLIANPNAGLPQIINGETVFNITPDEFAQYMVKLSEKGVTILGGCCGTTPKHIEATVKATANLCFKLPTPKNKTVVSSYSQWVEVDDKPILIGERINPTGKSKLKEALRNEDFGYILNEGISQTNAGAHILDVNVGLPEIDEARLMCAVVEKLQGVTNLPLQLDSNNPKVLENAMRIYNGKPLINSVNGESESMEQIFPLVKRYGGTVIALTMDNNGIPQTAEGRLDIANKILKKAKEYGIKKKDIIVDPLCLTISSDINNALVTLKAVKLLKDNSFKTSLGVSNVSFGLPERQKINSSFFTSALENGLNCAIINPLHQGMMDTYHTFKALHGMDEACIEYINYINNIPTLPLPSSNDQNYSLSDSIINGIKENAISAAESLILNEKPINVINNHIIPALNIVGDGFEKQKFFLPQLLMSAEAATAAFEVIKTKLSSDAVDNKKAVVLATVKGDIHDIGKNIVKVLLESYGFKVYDLGRDVEPQKVLDCVNKTGCRLVGLSALMTTTLPSMEKTIELLKSRVDDIKVIVGGAVLTEEYTKMINADAYCKDAMTAVKYTVEYYK